MHFNIHWLMMLVRDMVETGMGITNLLRLTFPTKSFYIKHEPFFFETIGEARSDKMVI